MKADLGGLMKQAQQMQESMHKTQDDLAKAEVEGQAGAGMVSVTMTGRYDVKCVHIDDAVMTETKEILEDLLAAAVNDAVRKVEDNNKNAMSVLTEGFNVPGGFKMPF
jgi:DNA-binding YbaB/EbfC family protein